VSSTPPGIALNITHNDFVVSLIGLLGCQHF
jgi:hypothetical protein